MPGTDCKSACVALFKSTGEAGAALVLFFPLAAGAVFVALAVCALLIPGATSIMSNVVRLNQNLLRVRIGIHWNTLDKTVEAPGGVTLLEPYLRYQYNVTERDRHA